MPFPRFPEEKPSTLGKRPIFSNSHVVKHCQPFSKDFSFEDGKLNGPAPPGSVGVVFEPTPDAIVAKVFQNRQDQWFLVRTHALPITSSSGIYQIFREDAIKFGKDPLGPDHQMAFTILGNYLLATETNHAHPKHTFTDEIIDSVRYFSSQITLTSGPVLTGDDAEKLDIATTTHSLGLPKDSIPLKSADMRTAAKSFLELLQKLFSKDKFVLVFQDDCAFAAGVLSDSEKIGDCYPSSEFSKLDLKGSHVLFLSQNPLTSAGKAGIKSLSTNTIFLSVHSD